MWILQLLLAWMLLYWFFRLIFWNGGKRDTDRSSKKSGPDISQDNSNYLRDAPDALRPDIEPDEFDPTDYF